MAQQDIIDELNYLNETKGLIKQAIISKGQTIVADTPFREYAQKINNITTGEDLEAELSAQEQVIQEMKIALANKTAGGEVKLNIYAQTTEPTNKDGIWLETNKKVDKYIFDDDIVMTEGFGDDIGTLSGSFSDGCATLIGNTLWVFGLWSNWGTGCKYNLDTGEKSTFTAPANCRWAKCVAINTDIYLWSGTSTYKYDTLTGNSIQLNDSPTNVGGYTNGGCFYYSNYIYLINGSILYKYDYTNDTYLTIKSHSAFSGICALYGNYIYSVYSSSSGVISIYKISIESGNVEEYANYTTSISGSLYPAVCIIDGLLYMFSPYSYSNNSNNAKKCYMFDIMSKQFTELSSAPRYLGEGKCFIYNGFIIIVGGSRGTSDVSNVLTKYNVAFKNFEDKSIIISQKTGSYKTNLIYTTPDNVFGLVNFFNNVWYYNDTDGLDDTIPTYYGDGAQWINFKNPPSNNS